MTGRTIPVTRTDGSEVASEATQRAYQGETDSPGHLLYPHCAMRCGERNKTNTDIVTELASIGGASAAAAGDTRASTTNGFLRWLRDRFKAFTRQQTSAQLVCHRGERWVFYRRRRDG